MGESAGVKAGVSQPSLINQVSVNPRLVEGNLESGNGEMRLVGERQRESKYYQ